MSLFTSPRENWRYVIDSAGNMIKIRAGLALKDGYREATQGDLDLLLSLEANRIETHPDLLAAQESALAAQLADHMARQEAAELELASAGGPLK